MGAFVVFVTNPMIIVDFAIWKSLVWLGIAYLVVMEVTWNIWKHSLKMATQCVQQDVVVFVLLRPQATSEIEDNHNLSEQNLNTYIFFLTWSINIGWNTYIQDARRHNALNNQFMKTMKAYWSIFIRTWLINM